MAYTHKRLLDPARALRTVLPVTLVLLILAVYPYTPQPALDVKVMLAPLLALVLSVLLLWQAARDGESPRAGLLFPLLAAFVAIKALGGLVSDYPGNSLSGTGRLVSFLVFFLAAARAYSDRRQVKRLILVLCIAMAITSVFGFMQRQGFDPAPLSKPAETHNLASTFGNANYAGHTLVLVLVLAAYLAAAEKSRLALALLPVFAIHLIMSHHRAGLLAVISAALFALLLLALARRTSIGSDRSVRSVRSYLAIPLTAAVLIVLAILAFFRPHLPLDSSLLLRYNSYFSASQMIAANPVLGYGPNNYAIENTRFWTPMEQEHFARRHKINDHPHSEILYAAVSGGIPAAAAFLALLAAMLIGSASLFFGAQNPGDRNLALMFAAFFFGWLVDGLFGFNFKAPVSGALFAVVAGLFDRATSTGAIRRPRVRRMCLPACLTAATAFFAVLAVRAFAATVLVSSARHDMARDAYRPAQQKLEHAEKLEPWNWRVSYLLAHAAVKMADGEGAADCFGRALRKNPNHIPSLIERGQMNVGTAAGGDLEEAENCARRALQLCKPLPEGLDLLGRVAFYRARGKAAGTERDRLLEETRRYCRDAMACGAGNRSTLHEIIGETHAAQGDFKAAEKSFGLAARNCPPDGNLWVSYQQLASMTDDYTGFADSLEAAIGIMERDARRYKRDLESARACLGRIHLESGRDEQALADFRAIVQADPASGYWRGYLEAAMRLNKLEQFFADMRKLNPGLLKSGPPEQQIVYTRHLLATVGPAAARAHIIEVLRTQKLDDEQRRALEAELATIPQTQ